MAEYVLTDFKPKRTGFFTVSNKFESLYANIISSNDNPDYGLYSALLAVNNVLPTNSTTFSNTTITAVTDSVLTAATMRPSIYRINGNVLARGAAAYDTVAEYKLNGGSVVVASSFPVPEIKIDNTTLSVEEFNKIVFDAVAIFGYGMLGTLLQCINRNNPGIINRQLRTYLEAIPSDAIKTTAANIESARFMVYTSRALDKQAIIYINALIANIVGNIYPLLTSANDVITELHIIKDNDVEFLRNIGNQVSNKEIAEIFNAGVHAYPILFIELKAKGAKRPYYYGFVGEIYSRRHATNLAFIGSKSHVVVDADYEYDPKRKKYVWVKPWPRLLTRSKSMYPAYSKNPGAGPMASSAAPRARTLNAAAPAATYSLRTQAILEEIAYAMRQAVNSASTITSESPSSTGERPRFVVPRST